MIAIIDSGGANIASVRFALERLGVAGELTADPAVIAGAERVILPGVGAAPAAMAQLESAGLVECIRGLTQPVLGICLGMQLLFERSEEGDTPLLGLIDGTVLAFDPAGGLHRAAYGLEQAEPAGRRCRASAAGRHRARRSCLFRAWLRGAGVGEHGRGLQLRHGFHGSGRARQFHGGAVPPRAFGPHRRQNTSEFCFATSEKELK